MDIPEIHPLLKSCIDLESQSIRSVQSVSHRDESNIWVFEKFKIVNMLSMNDIEPAQIHWAVKVLAVPKKHEVVWFWAAYNRLNVVKVRKQ